MEVFLVPDDTLVKEAQERPICDGLGIQSPRIHSDHDIATYCGYHDSFDANQKRSATIHVRASSYPMNFGSGDPPTRRYCHHSRNDPSHEWHYPVPVSKPLVFSQTICAFLSGFA